MFNVHFNFRSVLISLAIVFLLTNFSLFFTTPVNAATGINRTINFQGKLVNNSGGTNLANGTYSMIFAFYNHPTLGTTTTGYLWKEVYTNSVTVTDGIFRVALGSQTAFPANFNFNWDGLYLGVTVGGDSEMTPRIQMAAVPFAFNSQQVAGLTVLDSAGSVASTSATLKIGTSGSSPITVDLGTHNLSFANTTGDTYLSLPIIASGQGGTVLGYSTGASTGTLTSINNSTTQTNSETGLSITLGSANAQTQTGLQFNLSGTGTANDVVGTSGWSINKTGTGTFAGLSIAVAGAINSATAGNLSIGAATTTGLIFGNNTLSSGITLNVGSSAYVTLKQNGSAFVCNNTTGKLVVDGSGNIICGTDYNTGYSPFQEKSGANGGIIFANNSTMDTLFGGQSTASAAFRVTGQGNPFAGTLVGAAVTANTSYAGLVVNQAGVGDIFTASASAGTSLFTIRQNGSIAMAGNGIGINFTGTGISSITTANNQNFAINPGGAGLMGINTDGIAPLANFDVRANVGTIAIASVSGQTSYAGLIVDNSGTGDLITASTSGATKFVVRQNGSVGIGVGTSATPTGYTLDVSGNARIGGNTNGDDVVKQTTADFTVTTPTSYSVGSPVDGANKVSTTGNQIGLVTDLISAPGFTSLTAPAAGPALGQTVATAALTFQRPDKKFVLISNSLAKIYDPATNIMGGGVAFTTGSVGAGLNAFQRPDGNFIVVLGGATTTTQMYSPGANTNELGTFTLGPVTSAAVGAGSLVIRRSDGKVLVIHGGTAATSSVYDPAGGTTSIGVFITGPVLTAGVNTGSFAFQRADGKWIVGLGGSTSTNIYDPSASAGGGSGGTFVAGPPLSAASGAGAHAIQLPDGRMLVILGGGANTSIYDPVTNAFTAGNALVSSQVVGAGGHSFQRSDGQWVVVLGGGTTNLQIYNPATNTFSTTTGLTGAGAGAGAHSFQRPDGMYIIIHGNTQATSTLYDAGWNTTGTWTSEDISSTKISTYSALLWSANPQSANNNTRLDQETMTVSVKTGNSSGTLASAPWVMLNDSGDLIGSVFTNPTLVKIKVDFTTPVRSYPQGVTDYITQTNIWNGEGGTFLRRTFIQPTVFSLKVQNPLVAYGDQTGTGDPAFGRNFATDSATLEGVYTDNTDMLKLTTNRNMPASTPSGGLIIASASANLGATAGAGTHTIELANGQFLVIIGGTSTTRIYDQNSNTFSAGPALPFAAGAGAHSFLLPDGRFFTVLGGATSNNTAIYDPASNVFYAGPKLYGNQGAGANTIQLPDGRFLIVNGGGANSTNMLDPFSMAVTQGPFTTPTEVVSSGALNIRRPDGRILLLAGNSGTVANYYDPASNSFAMTGATAGDFPSAAIGAGSVAVQLSNGKFWIKSSATTTTMIYDPSSNTPGTYLQFVAGPATTASAGNGALVIPRPDGKFIYMAGAASTVNDPANTIAGVAGPTLPCTIAAGGTVFQRDTGEYVVICGGAATTFIVDAGWNLGGTYTSEQIYVPNLSSSTGMYWKNYSGLGDINVKYRTAQTPMALGMKQWNQLPNDGSLLSISANDVWFQTRIDLTGTLYNMPGAKSRVWLSESSGGMVAYYRQVQAPVLQYWKLMSGSTPTLLTLTSNNSSVFRFNADGQAFTSDGGAWNSGGADLAERYTSTDDLQDGEVVVGDKLNSQGVIRSTAQYQSNIMGVVSTQPGFVAGAYTANSYPIALVGRVPLKISTENGAIHSGDYLTSSSIPGYAMKATVAGRVLGTALQDFDPTDPSQVADCPPYGAGNLTATQCGTITAFINLTNYNGESVELAMADAGFTNPNLASASAGLSDIDANTGLNSYMNQISVNDQNTLAYLESLKDAGSAAFNSSQVFTGKVVAGEVVSSDIVADLITAKTIRADHIEGLEILTNQLSALSNSVAVLSDATESAQMATASAQLPSTLNLATLNINGLATISGDLNVQGNGFIQGALNVLDNITTNNLLVSKFAYFINDVVFKGNVRFNGTPTFNSDMAGFAVIKQGQDSVQIAFDQEYANTPVVTTSIALDKSVGTDVVAQKQLEESILNGNISYVITNRTTKGFTIRLSKPALEDINFSWVALSVQNAKTSGLTPVVTPDPSSTQSAAFQSILNQIETPTPTP